jgi:methyl-accepting chemotaxis protein
MSSQAEHLQQAMAFFRLDGAAGPRKPAGRKPAGRSAAQSKRQGIAIQAPAFATEGGLDESSFTRFN